MGKLLYFLRLKVIEEAHLSVRNQENIWMKNNQSHIGYLFLAISLYYLIFKISLRPGINLTHGKMAVMLLLDQKVIC